MATLQDILGKKTLNKIGGQITAGPTPLAPGAEGSTSMSPLGQAMAGANPDQSKMAGTPNQKKGVVNQVAQPSSLGNVAQNTLSPEHQLSTLIRTSQTNAAQTDQSRQILQQSAGLAPLTNLAGQVQQNVSSALTGPVANLPAIQQQLSTLASNLAANPNDGQSLLQAATLLGITAPNTQEEAQAIITKLNASLPKAATDLSASIAPGLNQQTIMTDDEFKQIGFKGGIAEAAQVLGMDIPTITKLSLGELVDRAASTLHQFDTVKSLQTQAADPLLGAVDRANARKQLLEAGATGVAAADSDMDKLADSVVNADLVTVDGEQMSVEQLLSSEYISGLAARYYSTPGFSDHLKQSNPELAQFFDNNQKILADQIKNISPAVIAFADKQIANNALAKTRQGFTLSKDLMQMVYPTFGTQSTESFDPNASETLRLLYKGTPISEAEQQDLYTSISSIGEMNPLVAADILKHANEGDLRAAGLLDTASKEGKQFIQNLKLVNEVSQLDDSPSMDQLARLAGAGSDSNLRALITRAYDMDRSGQFGPMSFDISDFNADAMKTFAQIIKNYGADTMDEVKNLPNTLGAEFNALQDYVNQSSSPGFSALSPYIQNRSTVDANEAATLANTASPASIRAIVLDPKLSQLVEPAAIKTLQDRYFNDVYTTVLSPILSIGGVSNPDTFKPDLKWNAASTMPSIPSISSMQTQDPNQASINVIQLQNLQKFGQTKTPFSDLTDDMKINQAIADVNTAASATEEMIKSLSAWNESNGDAITKPRINAIISQVSTNLSTQKKMALDGINAQKTWNHYPKEQIPDLIRMYQGIAQPAAESGGNSHGTTTGPFGTSLPTRGKIL